jgi:hypothetical protein
MKKNLFAIAATALLAICSVTASFAQIEITPFGGWLWTGQVPAYRQNMKADDNGNFGLRVGYQIRPGKTVEFEYNRSESTLRYYDFNSEQREARPFAMNYYLLGGQYEMSQGDVVPYGLLNIGAVNFTAQDGRRESATWLAAGLGGGIKYFFSDAIGLRLQARLLFPMQFSGISLGCGIGAGGASCGTGINSYSTIIQGDFTGGVVIRIATN